MIEKIKQLIEDLEDYDKFEFIQTGRGEFINKDQVIDDLKEIIKSENT